MSLYNSYEFQKLIEDKEESVYIKFLILLVKHIDNLEFIIEKQNNIIQGLKIIQTTSLENKIKGSDKNKKK